MVVIIVPAYNAARTIARCLESIFAQTYREFKVMIVDDGSKDETVKMVEKVKTEKKVPIIIVQQENRGAQAARNRGWKEAYRHPRPGSGIHNQQSNVDSRFRGNDIPLYVLFCDADIVLRPDCLEKMVRALTEHPEASYAYSSFRFGWKKFKLWPFDAARLRKMPYIHTTSLIRRSAIEEIQSLSRQRLDLRISAGPFDETITRLQDWDLWLTMLEQGHTGVWIPEVLFRVISTKGTMSQWLPSFTYKLPKWLGIHPKAVAHYNEAVARIKEKHHLK